MVRMSLEVFQQFVAAVNSRNVDEIACLMTADHLFVDALGNRIESAAKMEAGWRGYFLMCPDYAIRVDHALADGELVLAAGAAGGTIDGQPWGIPAAWKVMIRGRKVAEWRVFADNKPVYEILARRQTK